jgi:hypothetical protein
MQSCNEKETQAEARERRHDNPGVMVAKAPARACGCRTLMRRLWINLPGLPVALLLAGLVFDAHLQQTMSIMPAPR